MARFTSMARYLGYRMARNLQSKDTPPIDNIIRELAYLYASDESFRRRVDKRKLFRGTEEVAFDIFLTDEDIERRILKKVGSNA